MCLGGDRPQAAIGSSRKTEPIARMWLRANRYSSRGPGTCWRACSSMAVSRSGPGRRSVARTGILVPDRSINSADPAADKLRTQWARSPFGCATIQPSSVRATTRKRCRSTSVFRPRTTSSSTGPNPNRRRTTPTSRFGVVKNNSWNTVVQNGERPISLRALERPDSFVSATRFLLSVDSALSGRDRRHVAEEEADGSRCDRHVAAAITSPTPGLAWVSASAASWSFLPPAHSTDTCRDFPRHSSAFGSIGEPRGGIPGRAPFSSLLSG